MAKRKRIDPKLVKKVQERSGGTCEICGCRPATEIHHIFFGRGLRKLVEILDCLLHLCWECHRGNGAGQKGIHFNKELDNKLKAESQQKLLNKGYNLDEVRKITGGKIYL